MTDREKHTPTPWKVVKEGYPGDAYECFCIFAKRGLHAVTKGLDASISGPMKDGPICIDIQSQANAEFIVRAVNNHDALIEACKAVISATQDEGILLKEMCEAIPIVKAAIEKAEVQL